MWALGARKTAGTAMTENRSVLGSIPSLVIASRGLLGFAWGLRPPPPSVVLNPPPPMPSALSQAHRSERPPTAAANAFSGRQGAVRARRPHACFPGSSRRLLVLDKVCLPHHDWEYRRLPAGQCEDDLSPHRMMPGPGQMAVIRSCEMERHRGVLPVGHRERPARKHQRLAAHLAPSAATPLRADLGRELDGSNASRSTALKAHPRHMPGDHARGAGQRDHRRAHGR